MKCYSTFSPHEVMIFTLVNSTSGMDLVSLRAEDSRCNAPFPPRGGALSELLFIAAGEIKHELL